MSNPDNAWRKQLRVRLGEPGEPVDLILLEQLAEHLRSAMREIVKELTGEANPRVKLLVGDAQKGSLVLDMVPEIESETALGAERVSQVLIDDINSLEIGEARPDMGTNLLSQYRDLARVGGRAGVLEVGFNGKSVSLGRERKVAFDSALKEQPEVDVKIAGYIETVNIHSRPWNLGLYTKLDRQRLTCWFSDDMLDDVLRLMELRQLVEVTGEALFAPVGITPRSMTLDCPPKLLEFQADYLKSFRRSANIVAEGESAADAVTRIREELAKFG